MRLPLTSAKEVGVQDNKDSGPPFAVSADEVAAGQAVSPETLVELLRDRAGIEVPADTIRRWSAADVATVRDWAWCQDHALPDVLLRWIAGAQAGDIDELLAAAADVGDRVLVEPEDARALLERLEHGRQHEEWLRTQTRVASCYADQVDELERAREDLIDSIARALGPYLDADRPLVESIRELVREHQADETGHTALLDEGGTSERWRGATDDQVLHAAELALHQIVLRALGVSHAADTLALVRNLRAEARCNTVPSADRAAMGGLHACL